MGTARPPCVLVCVLGWMEDPGLSLLGVVAGQVLLFAPGATWGPFVTLSRLVRYALGPHTDSRRASIP